LQPTIKALVLPELAVLRPEQQEPQLVLPQAALALPLVFRKELPGLHLPQELQALLFSQPVSALLS
jgi:hypothetical protein